MNVNDNGWVEFRPRRANKMEKYASQIVVILTGTKSRIMYLTDAVMKALGNPEQVSFRLRGNNIAIAPVASGGFKVQEKKTSTFHKVAATSLANYRNLEAGVYSAHIESGTVIFDGAQTPSRL